MSMANASILLVDSSACVMLDSNWIKLATTVQVISRLT